MATMTATAGVLLARRHAPARSGPHAAVRGARVLVSIHDATPAYEAEVRLLWTACLDVGFVPALLVVPDWHGAWPLERHPAFVDWLRQRADDGADVVLHGLRHDEQGTRRTWRDHLRALGRTSGEGEFLALPHAAARARIRDGLARLRALGLDPIGFIPPAWLMRADALDAIAAEGLTLTEDAGRVYLVRTRRPLLGPRVHAMHAPAWRWSGRSAARAWGSAAVALARWWATDMDRSRMLRIALHPRDLAHPATRRSVHDTLARVAGRAHGLRYRDLLPSSGTLGDTDAE